MQQFGISRGTVRRALKSLVEEGQYARAWDGEASRADTTEALVDHYNWGRPHSACGGLPPMSRIHGVNNVMAHNA